MQTTKKILNELLLPLILCWFMMTVFVDIFTVPTVFRNVQSLQQAGQVGMTVFSRFNRFELVFALIILITALMRFPARKLFYFALPLFTLALLYNFIMTPKIINLTNAISLTAINDPQYAVLQSEHARFHNLYRQFDTAKLAGLLIFFIVAFMDNLKNRALIKQESNS